MNNTDADLPILDTAEVAEFDMPAKETRPPAYIKTRLINSMSSGSSSDSHYDDKDDHDGG